MVDPLEQPLADHVVQGLERDPGVDGAGAIADQQAHVMHLARIPGLDHQATPGARALPYQMVVHRGGGEQAGDGRVLAIDVAIGEDHDVGARGNRLARPLPQVFHSSGESLPTLGCAVARGERRCPESGGRHVPELGQVGVVDHRILEIDLTARLGLGYEEVTLGPDRALHRGHQLLADRIEWWIGNLREELLEIVVQHARPVGKHGERRIRAHRSDRLLTLARHRCEQDAEVLVRVSEEDLMVEHGLVVGLEDWSVG